MRTLINTLLLGAVLLVFAGCSRHEAASALDAVGSNASSVIAMKPNAVAVSLGVTDAGDVAALLPPGRRFADLRTVLALDGLDMDCWVSANFREGDRNVSVMAVRDMDALDKSLGKLGYKKGQSGDFEVYSPANALKASTSMFLLVDGDYLWMMEAGAAGTAASELKDIKKGATAPLSSWKREALSGPAAINAIVEYRSHTAKVAVDFDANRMNIDAEGVDADGKSAKWLEGDGYGHLGAAEASELSAGAMLSFAVARGDYSDVLRLVSKLGIFEISRAQMAAVSASVAGPVWGNLNIKLPLNGLDDINANLSVTAKSSAAAALMLMGAKSELSRQGLDGFIESRVDGDVLKLSTSAPVSGGSVDAKDVDGCIAWLNLNIPAEALGMLTGADRCGIKARAALRDERLNISVEFTGSDEPFLSTAIQLLGKQ